MSTYFFFNRDNAHTWPVHDPIAWCLEHRCNTLLERACSRLLLSPDDPERVLRVVLRRCGLVLIHVTEAHIEVNYWGEPVPDVREFAEERGLIAFDGSIAFNNLKTSKIMFYRHAADVLLSGDPAEQKFPWALFEAKWKKRHDQEKDDWQIAPESFGTLSWERASSERMIPWAVLKSAWRHDGACCINCGTRLMIVRFQWVPPTERS